MITHFNLNFNNIFNLALSFGPYFSSHTDDTPLYDISTASIPFFFKQWTNSVDIYSLRCSSCHQKGQFIRYGYYHRFIKVYGKKVKLKVARLMCKHCHHTHALVPVCIVPYTQILVGDIINIISKPSSHQDIMDNNPAISPKDIHYILSNYHRIWHDKLSSIHLDISFDVSFIIQCFHAFSSQFMQIRSLLNVL